MKIAEEKKQWRCPCRGVACDETCCNGTQEEYRIGGKECRKELREVDMEGVK